MSNANQDVVDSFIEVLNSAFAADQNAIHALCVNRVPCNKDLAEHEFVEVMESPVLNGQCFQVGTIGLLNGLLVSAGLDKIAMRFIEPDSSGVKKIIGFCRAT